jgi:hypothetical protein
VLWCLLQKSLKLVAASVEGFDQLEMPARWQLTGSSLLRVRDAKCRQVVEWCLVLLPQAEVVEEEVEEEVEVEEVPQRPASPFAALFGGSRQQQQVVEEEEEEEEEEVRRLHQRVWQLMRQLIKSVVYLEVVHVVHVLWHHNPAGITKYWF